MSERSPMPVVLFSTPYMRPEDVPAERRDERPDRYQVDWPEGWPPPATGDYVASAEGIPLLVRHVSWYPHGGETTKEPFVYVSLGWPS